MIMFDMAKKKRIVFVANTGFALHNFRLTFMKHLMKDGWEVVAVASDEADYAQKFENESIRFINLFIDHKGQNPGYDLKMVFDLVAIYRREWPQIIHHFTIKPVIFGSIAAKIVGVPSIVNTITGLGYVFDAGGWLERLTLWLYRLAFRGRVHVIFQNSDNRNLFLKHRLIAPYHAHLILGSGVDTNTLRPAESHADTISPTFLMISRMLWSKGVGEFVAAAQMVKSRHPQCRFIMAGGVSGGGAQGNPQAIPEEWLQKVNTDGVVRWLGRIPFDYAMKLIDHATAVVLPSYSEGIPKSLIEAAAKGKAIITTDAPGCRDVVVHGENGFLVPPKNTERLAARMCDIIAHPERTAAMGRAGRERAVRFFDEKIVFGKTCKVYERAQAALANPKGHFSYR